MNVNFFGLHDSDSDSDFDFLSLSLSLSLSLALLSNRCFRSHVGEEVLLDCLKYIESLLEKATGRALLVQFYTDGTELVKIILLAANKTLSLAYVNRTLKLAVRILQLGEGRGLSLTCAYVHWIKIDILSMILINFTDISESM